MSQLNSRTLAVWLPLLALLLLSRGLPFDQQLVDWSHLHQSKLAINASLLITNLGSPTVVLILAFVLSTGLFALKRRRQAAFVLLSVLGVSVLNEGVKQVFRHPIVQVTPGLSPHFTAPRNLSLTVETPALPRKVYAFPSGHAAGSLALLLVLSTLSWPARQRTAVVVSCAVIAVLIGMTRVYLWVHFVSDVLGGWAIATAWVALIYLTILNPTSDGKQTFER